MRRLWLTALARHFHLHPRDLDRLRLWEFWEFIAAAEQLTKQESG